MDIKSEFFFLYARGIGGAEEEFVWNWPVVRVVYLSRGFCGSRRLGLIDLSFFQKIGIQVGNPCTRTQMKHMLFGPDGVGWLTISSDGKAEGFSGRVWSGGDAGGSEIWSMSLMCFDEVVSRMTVFPSEDDRVQDMSIEIGGEVRWFSSATRYKVFIHIIPSVAPLLSKLGIIRQWHQVVPTSWLGSLSGIHLLIRQSPTRRF